MNLLHAALGAAVATSLGGLFACWFVLVPASLIGMRDDRRWFAVFAIAWAGFTCWTLWEMFS